MTLNPGPTINLLPIATEAPHVIETAHGQHVDLAHPDPDTIDIRDIAHHLSRINRFTGATHGSAGLSVAQHALWVHYYLIHSGTGHELALHGLLANAAEAYLGHLAAPLRRIPTIHAAYAPLESRMLWAIYSRLGLWLPDATQRARIKAADRQARAIEVLDCMPSAGIGSHWKALPPTEAASKAVYRHYRPGATYPPDSVAQHWLAMYHILRESTQ